MPVRCQRKRQLIKSFLLKEFKNMIYNLFLCHELEVGPAFVVVLRIREDCFWIELDPFPEMSDSRSLR